MEPEVLLPEEGHEVAEVGEALGEPSARVEEELALCLECAAEHPHRLAAGPHQVQRAEAVRAPVPAKIKMPRIKKSKPKPPAADPVTSLKRRPIG